MDWLSSLKLGDTVIYGDEILTVNKELYFTNSCWKVRVNRKHYKNSYYLQHYDGLIYFSFERSSIRPLYYKQATVIPAPVLQSPEIQRLSAEFISSQV